MEAGAAAVVEGLGHESGQPPFGAGQLAHGGLEAEGAVGCVQGGGVGEVDLELATVELLVAGGDTDAEAVQLPQGAQQVTVRVAA